MELSQNTLDSVKTYFQNCDKDRELECEAVLNLNTERTSKVTLAEFQKVFKYLCRSKKSFRKQDDVVTLDVFLKNQNAEKIRFTVPGSELIHGYCRGETISHEKVSSMKKQVVKTLKTDYYFRVNLKNEARLTEQQHEELWNKNQSKKQLIFADIPTPNLEENSIKATKDMKIITKYIYY